MKETTRLSRPDATLATYTVSRSIRDRLAEAGWQNITKRKGFGRKRECLAAHCVKHEERSTNREPWFAPPTKTFDTNSRIAVIGNGVAAWCLMRSLRDSGYRPELFFKESDQTSSHLPTALICPKLVRGGGAYRTFNQLAFLDSVRELDDLEDVWNRHRGVLIANDGNEEMKKRQLQLLESLDDEWIENEEIIYVNDASSKLGSSCDGGGLYLQRGGCIVPSRLRESLVMGIHDEAVEAKVSKICQLQDKRFELISEEGLKETFDVVIVATGSESSNLLPSHVIPGSTFRTSHGMVLTCKGDRPPLTSVLRERNIGGGTPVLSSLFPLPCIHTNTHT